MKKHKKKVVNSVDDLEFAYFENPYFKKEELICKETGEYRFDAAFLAKLIDLRRECNFPFRISSAFRSIHHPIESRKIAQGKQPGAHNYSRSVDILCSGKRAYKAAKIAMVMGFRVGISQKGNIRKRFIHIDDMTGEDEKRFSCPIWSY